MKDMEVKEAAKLNYTPRQVIKDFGLHSDDWQYCAMLCHRRFGKSVGAVAESSRRIWNTGRAPDGTGYDYLYYTAQVKQGVDNVADYYTNIAGDYISKRDDYHHEILFKNGAKLSIGGERTLNAIRGRRLAGVIIDEFASLSLAQLTEVILPALFDSNGWLLIIGTATYMRDYASYEFFKSLEEDSQWKTLKIGVEESNIYSREQIDKQHSMHMKFCKAQGMNSYDSQKIWNVEMLCDFSDYEQGRPNMSAIFYKELESMFNSGRIKDMAPTEAERYAVMDIASGNGRDYSVAVITEHSYETPKIFSILYDNKISLDEWRAMLKSMGVNNVVLPFDAKQRNRDTGLTTIDMFNAAGFNTKILKRLNKVDQVECGRWLLERCEADSSCVTALREVGKLCEFKGSHGLDQDITDAILYTGQFLQKKGVSDASKKRWEDFRKKPRQVLHDGSEFIDGFAPAFF